MIFLLWLILLVISWPVALIALFLFPIIWILLLPFKLIGITVRVVFEILFAIIAFPLKLLRGPSAWR